MQLISLDLSRQQPDSIIYPPFMNLQFFDVSNAALLFINYEPHAG